MSVKKIISLILVSALVLSSCWKEEETNVAVEKIPFNVEYVSSSDLSKEVKVEKVWRISGAQDITVNSQTFWKVAVINFVEWESVKKGQVVASLTDTVWNLWIRVAQAKTSLERAKLSYENTKISMDKSISDATIALEQAWNKLELVKATNSNNINLAEWQKSSSDIDNNASQASIDLAKTKDSLDKLEVDLSNTHQSNKDNVNAIINSTKVEIITFSTLYSDVIEELDIILWVTDKNKYLNNDYEDYLWAKVSSTLSDAKIEFNRVYAKKEEYFSLIDSGVSESNVKEVMEGIQNGYSDLISLLGSVDIMFKNSVEIDWELATPIAAVKWYQTSTQSKNAAFIAFKNSSDSFLNTYKITEKSLALNLELQKKQYESMRLAYAKADNDTKISYNQTVSSSQDALLDAEINLKNAKIALQNIKDRKEVALKQEQNAIDSAELSLTEAQKEYNKLFIKAPISGRLSSIFVDVWQEVSSSSQIFKVVSDSEQEIEISLPEAELSFVSAGKTVSVEVNGKNINWKIVSVSNVADANLNYKATISLDETVNFIGWSVKVSISSESTNLLLPISYVNTLSDNKGYIYVLENDLPVKKDVELWRVWGSSIEILTDLADSRVVTTDMTNFDENKFKIVIK